MVEEDTRHSSFCPRWWEGLLWAVCLASTGLIHGAPHRSHCIGRCMSVFFADTTVSEMVLALPVPPAVQRRAAIPGWPMQSRAMAARAARATRAARRSHPEASELGGDDRGGRATADGRWTPCSGPVRGYRGGGCHRDRHRGTAEPKTDALWRALNGGGSGVVEVPFVSILHWFCVHYRPANSAVPGSSRGFQLDGSAALTPGIG